MKYTLLIVIAVMLVSTHAYERLWSKGDSLLSELQNGDSSLHFVMFFDSTFDPKNYAKTVANDQTTKDLIEYMTSISEGGKTPFPAPITFSKVDSVDDFNANLMFKFAVKAKDLEKGPTVVALRDGKGYSVDGPQIISELKKCVAKMGGAAEEKKAEEKPKSE